MVPPAALDHLMRDEAFELLEGFRMERAPDRPLERLGETIHIPTGGHPELDPKVFVRDSAER